MDVKVISDIIKEMAKSLGYKNSGEEMYYGESPTLGFEEFQEEIQKLLNPEKEYFIFHLAGLEQENWEAVLTFGVIEEYREYIGGTGRLVLAYIFDEDGEIVRIYKGKRFEQLIKRSLPKKTGNDLLNLLEIENLNIIER